MKKIVLACAAIVVTGCVSTAWLDTVQSQVNVKSCDAAMRTADTHAPDPGSKATTYGIVYFECKNDKMTAARYFFLGARYGNPVARDVLTEWGYPIPPADLVNANNSNGYRALELINSGLQGWNAGRASASGVNPALLQDDRQTINCVSNKAGNSVYTNCH